MFVLRVVAAVGGFIALSDAAVFGKSGKIEAAPKSLSTLRGSVVTNATAVGVSNSSMHSNRSGKNPPCNCVSSSDSWKRCARTTPRCVFIDLGAADGNTFEDFVNNKYGPTKNCPHGGEWSAILVEANPRFDSKLSEEKQKHQKADVTVMSSTAAYMCEGTTSFYLDTVNTQKNFWGSSMSSNHPDVQKSGQEKVTVPTMNLNKILLENTIQDDWVMVKMDIEGAEFDVLPCLAQEDSPAQLVDRLYLEQHSSSWGQVGTTDYEMETVKSELKFRGVDIPPYFSQTF